MPLLEVNNKNLQRHSIPIVWDAFWGLMVSFGVGFLAALFLALIVLLLSSNAHANTYANTHANSGTGLLDATPDHHTPNHQTPSYQTPYYQIRPHDAQQGSLFLKTDDQGPYTLAPTLKTDVEIKISGMVARVKVQQTFNNPNNTWAEAIYIFPLPENAAVDHMLMRIGERVIEGQIHERLNAKKIYAAAKSAGKKAALVEQQRPNIFTNSVANIGPGEQVIVAIEYQQTIEYEINMGAGHFNLRFPMTITPRYVPNSPNNSKIAETGPNRGFTENGRSTDREHVLDTSRITPLTINNQDSMHKLSLSIELQVGFPINEIKSLYHNVDIIHKGEGWATITLQDGQVIANRDFNLNWRPEIGIAPMAAKFTETKDGWEYHLIMIMPPSDGISGGQALAREVIYVIDTSGSMAGNSIIQAKQALQLALERLRPRDTFNIIQFNSYTDSLFDTAKSADTDNLYQARRFINSLDAEGGTEMIPALKVALMEQGDPSRVRQVIFMTDGAVGNERALFSLIQQQLGASRLFTIGIGSAPNSYFMKKAARFGHGTFTTIGKVDEVQNKMSALFEKLESPMLHKLNFQWSHGIEVETSTDRLPDLYLGEPVILIAKTKGTDGAFTLNGIRANQAWHIEIPLGTGKVSQGIGVLWARSKISSLTDSLYDGANQDQVRQSIVEIGLKHHLVSKHTSLVAVDITPSRLGSESLKTHGLKVNAPYGMRQQQAIGHFAQTATPGQLKISLGSLLFAVALLLYINRRRRQQNKVFVK